MGNSEKCISTKLTLFSFHDLFSKQRIRNFCCADLNKSPIWRPAKWFCETLRLPKMWWDCYGWARISPIFLPTNNPDVATSVLMVSWRPGGSSQPAVWFVCLWFVGLLGSTLVHTETEMLLHSLQHFHSILRLIYLIDWFYKKICLHCYNNINNTSVSMKQIYLSETNVGLRSWGNIWLHWIKIQSPPI